MAPLDMDRPWLTRRGLLVAGVAAGVSAFGTRAGFAAVPGCTLTSEQEEGPYYIDDKKLRAVITEGKPGLPIKLRIAVVDSRSCAPLANAALDIWHCDASGVYSGFTAMSPDGGGGRGRGPGGPGGPPPEGFRPDGPRPGGPPSDFALGGGGRGFGPPPGGPGGRGRGQTDATRFLRGVQLSDKKGLVEFSTLYPGWYSGRAIHIHLKAHIGSANGNVAHTGQFFFPEDLTEQIAKLEPYSKRLSINRTTQDEDNIFRSQHGAEQMLTMTRLGKTNAEGFLATVTVAVNPEATPAPVDGRGGGRGGPGPR